MQFFNIIIAIIRRLTYFFPLVLSAFAFYSSIIPFYSILFLYYSFIFSLLFFYSILFLYYILHRSPPNVSFHVKNL